MLRRLFSWEHAITAAVVMYVACGGLWFLAIQVDHPKPLFYLDGTVLAITYLWTLGAIWMHPGFRRTTRLRARRYSDQVPTEHSDVLAHDYAVKNPERRKRRMRSSRRRERWLVVWSSAAVFSAVGAEFFLSYKDQMSKSQQMRVQVFLMDTDKTRTHARSAPIGDQGIAPREMMFSVAGIPTRNVTIRSSDRSMVTTVVIRNSGDLEIDNAHIIISSNVAIKAASPKVVQVSDKELRVEVDDLPAFRRTGSETLIPVEIPITESHVRAGLFVTILREGVHPYAAAAKVIIVKQAEGALPVAAEETRLR